MRLVSKDILGSEKDPERSKLGVREELGTDAFQSARTGLGDSKRSFLEPDRPVLLISAEVLKRHRQIRARQMLRDPRITEARIRRRRGNIPPAAFIKKIRQELVPPKDFGV